MKKHRLLIVMADGRVYEVPPTPVIGKRLEAPMRFAGRQKRWTALFDLVSAGPDFVLFRERRGRGRRHMRLAPANWMLRVPPAVPGAVPG